MELEELDLYVTNKCNLKCDFCSVKARTEMDELSLEKIKSIIKEAKILGLKDLHITGGEPTLRNDLEEIISFATLEKLNVRLITNGSLLNLDRLKKLYHCGLRSIMISLDGLSSYHNNVRGKNAFERTIETVKNAISLKMLVRVNSVAWKDNKNEIISLIPLLNDIGVDVYSIFLGSPLGYAINHKKNVISANEWRDFCDSLRTFSRLNSNRMKIIVEKGFLFEDEFTKDLTDIQGRGRGCYSITKHTDFLQIRSNGDVYPCVFFSNQGEPIGNINISTINDILENFSSNKFYNHIGECPQECDLCSIVRICHGGCRGYAKLYYDDWFSKDPRCFSLNQHPYFPLCPIVKLYLNEDIIGGSSEQVLKNSSN